MKKLKPIESDKLIEELRGEITDLHQIIKGYVKENEDLQDKVLSYQSICQARKQDNDDLEEQLSIAKQAMEYLEGYVSVVRKMR